MYGLVNNGVRRLVMDTHDEETWQTICGMAGVASDEFETMTAYDDALTLALVHATSQKLGLSIDNVLQVFGEYWVGYSKCTAIGKLIYQGGETLWDQIRGLDDLHERVQLTMPDLEPPSFDLEALPDGSHRLHYHSKRDGLSPMVIGLLQGMAEDCGVTLHVDQIESKARGADHDVFILNLVAASAAA